MVVRRQILRLSFHCSAFTFSNIRHFTPLRMTKCAAEYRWRRCLKVVCSRQSLVTSHARLPTPSGSSLISSFFSLSNLFIPHNKKRGENTILPDYIVGDERISADIPKKRGWAFIYFIKINNAKEAQKADSIGNHLTPMLQKYTIDIYP